MLVIGYGPVGQGIAAYAKALGAVVAVIERDPVQSLIAHYDGYSTAPIEEALSRAEIIVTATGMKDIIAGDHFDKMKDGAILCNTGHYDCEINLGHLEAKSKSKRTIRDNCEEYLQHDGRRIYVIGQGRLVNLAAAEGHPSEVMDMSFANQFLGMVFMAENGKGLEGKVYDIPPEQDQDLARIKLATMGLAIDSLTPEQVAYADNYLEGT